MIVLGIGTAQRWLGTAVGVRLSDKRRDTASCEIAERTSKNREPLDSSPCFSGRPSREDILEPVQVFIFFSSFQLRFAAISHNS